MRWRQLATAKAKADAIRRLTAQNAIAGQQFDDAQADYLEAKAAVESARLNVEFTTIRAPVNGKTGRHPDQPGNMVGRLDGQHQRHAAGHHQRNPAGEDFLGAASVRPAAHPGNAAHQGPHHHRRLAQYGWRLDIQVPVNFIGNAVTNNTGTSNSAGPTTIPTWRWCRASWWTCRGAVGNSQCAPGAA
jgi:multidrug efflux pump subunit AcrA (membrane-fusion protein)